MKLYNVILTLFLFLFGYVSMQISSEKQVSEQVIEIFNGEDLSGWEGDFQYWRVENGAIIGQFTEMPSTQYLYHEQEVEDFRLLFKVKTVEGGGNSGIQFRSEPLPNGHMRGPQADVGDGYWGKLYEEFGREWLWDDEECDRQHVDKEGWNLYEILAVDSKIRTVINGNLCVDLDDPFISRSGLIGLQLHAGFAPAEIHFKDFELTLNPEFKLVTLD